MIQCDIYTVCTCSVVLVISMSQSLSTMFTMQELDAFITKPIRLINYLRDRAVILPLRPTCPNSTRDNQHVMELTHNQEARDGFIYQCYECVNHFSMRYDSIFIHSHQELLVCCRMIVCFDLQLTVTQTTEKFQRSYIYNRRILV